MRSRRTAAGRYPAPRSQTRRAASVRGGAKVTGALAGLGEEVEQAWLEADPHETLLDHLAGRRGITLVEVAFGQQREARHVGGRGPLAAEKLRPRLPRVTVPQEIA